MSGIRTRAHVNKKGGGVGRRAGGREGLSVSWGAPSVCREGLWTAESRVQRPRQKSKRPSRSRCWFAFQSCQSLSHQRVRPPAPAPAATPWSERADCRIIGTGSDVSSELLKTMRLKCMLFVWLKNARSTVGKCSGRTSWIMHRVSSWTPPLASTAHQISWGFLLLRELSVFGKTFLFCFVLFFAKLSDWVAHLLKLVKRVPAPAEF